MEKSDNLYEQMNQWETPFLKEKGASTAPSRKSQSSKLTEEQPELVPSPSIPQMSERNVAELQSYVANAQNAISIVDDVVMKSYLERLDKMNVLAPNNLSECDIVIFKVNLMVYEKDEYATDKFISAFSAMTFTDNTVFLIVDGYEDRTDFYIGVRNNNPEFTTHSIAETFRCSFQGQFPGIDLEDLSLIEKGKNHSKQHQILRKVSQASSISSFAGIPSLKGENTNSNKSFIQGIEKFSDAMKGKRYTAIIIARNQRPSSIDAMRRAYENLYSQLSCMASQQIAYSTNESLANALTRSRGTTDTISKSVSDGTSTTDTTSDSYSKSKTKGTSKSTGESKQNAWGKTGMLASPLIQAGSVLSMSGAGAVVGVPMMAVGGILGQVGTIGGKTKSKNETVNESETENHQTSTSHSKGKTHNETIGNSHAESITDSEGNTSTVGSSKNFTLTLHNKHIEELLKRIDKQLERIESAESGGLWSASAYFLSYDSDFSTAQIGAAIYRSIVQGDDSGVETSALNRWNVNEEESNGQKLLSSLVALEHPQFSYPDGIGGEITVEGTSLMSSKEISMMMGLPRKSVPGLPVVEHIVLGQEVIRCNGVTNKNSINLGVIFDRGIERPHNLVNLDVKSLTQHVFVTGSTGCGKSETVYKLIDEAQETGATFLIIEPAKGEYKDVFGNVNVFGSNPLVTPLLRINPFRFPDGIHILEHIDRLTEIFNVCWPMYAAMPAVLKKAVLRAYEKCGWDLFTSTNKYGMKAYPSFVDLLLELETAIKESAYSEEVKGNYTGSLVTRVESLTNGLNGAIFSAIEIPDEVLFDQNTIIDLSRIGSQETKSLIMGLLVMRLNEYRMVNATQANNNLQHITVLEEAHNILQRTSTEQSMEGSNVAGKSVEMLINSIAEMRTYGEGFIIVDQSPTSVHASAIKNTNTKIIMRLPDGEDRLIAGKAAALKDDQVDEIAKLPTGVAIVYQNDWLQPVMCKVSMSQTKREKYVKKEDRSQVTSNELPIAELLKLLFKGRLRNPVEPRIDSIENALANAGLSTAFRLELLSLISEYKKTGKLKLWSDDNFASLSNLTARLLNLEKPVKEAVSKAVTFEDLNKMLSELLKDVKDLPASMNLILKQALMRNYGEDNLEQLKIYNAWLQDIKKIML